MSIEAMKQAAENVSKAYDVLAFAHTERALELLAKTRTSLRQAIANLESQKPDYWLGYGLQAHTEKPFENATALYTRPPQRTEPLIGCVNHDCEKCQEKNNDVF